MNPLFKTFALAAILAACARGQAPSANYLPPGGGGGSTAFGTGAGTGFGGSGSTGFGGGGSNGGGEEGGKPEPFSFSYEVKDAASGNDFSHRAESDGTKVTGEYQVLLPDGRRQKVAYTADEGGYNADVQYEGEASSGGTGAGSAGAAGGAGGYPSAGATGAGGANGYPSGRPSGPGLPSGSGPSGGAGGYPSGPSRPGNSYIPPGK